VCTGLLRRVRPGAGRPAGLGVGRQHQGDGRDDGGEHQQQRDRGHGLRARAQGTARRGVPAVQPGRGRPLLLREALLAERPGPRQHRDAVSPGPGSGPGGQRDRGRAQAGRRAEREPGRLGRAGGQRGTRREVAQPGRPQLEGPPGAAGRAALDVPLHPVAQPQRQPAVPARQHRAKLAAVLPPGPADEQYAEAGFELLPGHGQQCERAATGDAEHGRHLARGQALAQLELDHLTVTGAQARGRGLEQGAQLVAAGRIAGHRGRLAWPGRSLLRGPRPGAVGAPQRVRGERDGMVGSQRRSEKSWSRGSVAAAAAVPPAPVARVPVRCEAREDRGQGLLAVAQAARGLPVHRGWRFSRAPATVHGPDSESRRLLSIGDPARRRAPSPPTIPATSRSAPPL
jgi:hypothetical protein